MFKCKKCGAPVEIDGDKVKRSCTHADSAILADVSAHARGLSSLNREQPVKERPAVTEK